MKLFRNISHHAGELFIAEQGQQAESGADLSVAEFDGADGPRFGEHLEEGRRDGRGPGVPGFDLVEAPVEFLREARGIDTEVPEDVGGITIGGIEKLPEEVFNLDVVVCPGEGQSGGAFERGAGSLVQFAD